MVVCMCVLLCFGPLWTWVQLPMLRQDANLFFRACRDGPFRAVPGEQLLVIFQCAAVNDPGLASKLSLCEPSVQADIIEPGPQATAANGAPGAFADEVEVPVTVADNVQVEVANSPVDLFPCDHLALNGAGGGAPGTMNVSDEQTSLLSSRLSSGLRFAGPEPASAERTHVRC